jgi:hypothetical protein
LAAGSKIDYTYKTKRPPKKIKLVNKFYLQKRAKVKLNIIAQCKQTDFKSVDEIYLLGEKSSGISNLRFITKKQARVKAYSRMVAEAAGQGHLDCQSLNLAESGKVCLIPEVTVNHPRAQITHEASIGRVSQEQLNYLQMRGLSEQKAVDLIAAGFLQI